MDDVASLFTNVLSTEKISPSGRNTHFLSIVQFHCGWKLVKCLANRARKTFLIYTITKELELKHIILIDSGYPQGFLDKLCMQQTKYPYQQLARNLSFSKHNSMEIASGDALRKKITAALKRAFNVTDLCPSYTTQSMIFLLTLSISLLKWIKPW